MAPGNNTAVVTKTSQPGLQIVYNHDLNVGTEFTKNFPQIAEALRDQRLLEAVDFYERKAKFNKRMFHFVGLGSLILGMAALSGNALSLVMGGFWCGTTSTVDIVINAGSLLALILIIISRLGRFKMLWCQAVFCRERLRQWHFQVFLDGEFVSLLTKDANAFREELNRRWETLQQNLQDGYGMMMSFVRHGSTDEDLMHRLTPYEDTTQAAEVLEALRTLRFDHQLRFSQRKIEPESEHIGMALQERTTASESIATVTLAGAVLIGVFSFISSIFHLSSNLPSTSLGPTELGHILAGSALLLGVLSAASRAYRAGFTLPDESDSYEEYCDRIRERKVVFDSTGALKDKFQQIESLELEAAAELRRFIRMKMRATFIF